jgi:hypothetical protein
MNPLASHHALLSIQWGFPGILERPIAADMNDDGITDIGLFVPTSTTTGQDPAVDWYFLESPGHARLAGLTPGPASPYIGTVNALWHAFNPGPFSQDQMFHFGNGLFRPIVGLWDPPGPPSPPVVKVAPGSFTDVSLSAQIDNIDDGGSSGLFARRSANAQNEYWAGVARNGSTYTAQIKLLQNGVWHVLASGPAPTFTPGSTLTFDVVGTSLALSINGNEVLSVANGVLKTSGSAGSFSSAGTIIWPTQATAVTRTNATLPFSDDFTQADGKLLDLAWDETTGSFRTLGRALVAQAATNIALLHGASAGDVIQSVDIVTLPTTGGSANLFARYNQVTGAEYRAGVFSLYSAKTHTTTYTAQIWRKYGNRWTLLASAKVASGTGTLTFATIGGSQQLYLNGTLVAASTDRVLKVGGMGIDATKGVTLDNYGTQAPTLAAVSLPFSDSFFSGPMAGAWYANEGGFGLSSGALLGIGATNVLTLFGVSSASASLQTQVLNLAGGASAGVVARYNANNGDGYWAGLVASYNAKTKVTTYFAQIKRRVAGVWTVLSNKSVGTHPGVIKFDVSGSTLTLSFNGNVLSTVHDTKISAAGAMGISGSKGSLFDDFSAS